MPNEGQCWVNFWWINTWSPNYEIIDTDYDSYSIVYNCNSWVNELWFMTRSPVPSENLLKKMYESASLKLPNFDFDLMADQDI